MYDVVHDVLELVFTLTAPLILAYFLLINTSYLALVLISAVEFRGHMDRKDTRRDQIAGELAPGVSVIVPAYNEEALIVSSVQALLTLRYPQHEVVVVDDGSTDGTLARARPTPSTWSSCRATTRGRSRSGRPSTRCSCRATAAPG